METKREESPCKFESLERCLVYETPNTKEKLPQTREKARPDTQGCLLTSTYAVLSMHSHTHPYKHKEKKGRMEGGSFLSHSGGSKSEAEVSIKTAFPLMPTRERTCPHLSSIW